MGRHPGDVQVDEIADGVYRLSTYVASFDITFNQFLVAADEPLLFHTGLRSMFSVVHEAVSRLVDPAALRWLSFGHVEADECGSMNEWLAAAPHATVLFNTLGCMVSVDDLADRQPRSLDDGEAVDLGGRRVRLLRTPHAPHNWEAQVLFEETTATLLCGDLGATSGQVPAVRDDPASFVESALDCEAGLPAAAPGEAVPQALRRLAALRPRTLAVMHGSSFAGDGRSTLRSLADGWEERFGPSDPRTAGDTDGRAMGGRLR